MTTPTHDVEARLLSALSTIEELRRENARPRAQVAGLTPPLPNLASPSPEPPAADATVDAHSPGADKVALFRRLFRGREDVYALRWEARDGRSGYTPALRPGARRERGQRPDPRVLLPLGDEVIHGHLVGQRVVGLYPLLDDETCWLLVVDFDKSTWQADVEAVWRVCDTLGVPASVERSR